jgi:DNA modification methylase
MDIEMWPPDRPVPYARNARKLSAQAIDKVAASIREFGFRQPIVVDKAGTIIAGHTRLQAARKLQLETVPVHVAESLTPAQVKAFRLLDNRSHEESSWDEDLLGLELLDLKDLDMDLSLTGFDLGEIESYLASTEPIHGLTDEDAVPEVADVPVSALGDVWQLGNHRLLCGDATSAADAAKLMAGEAADLIFTDPPYNVDYEGYTKEKLKIQSDRMSDADFSRFLEQSFQAYRTSIKPGASLYVCHSSSKQREFQNALEHASFEVRCQIIWGKNTFAWGFGRYKFQHEPMFYCHVAGQKDPWYGDKSQSTLWQEKKPAANRLHPTMKPVELVERALLNSSKAGDVVADFFGGSGSTLIACERRGRKARLMELDPIYTDVIIRRWQDYTGKTAVHEVSGMTFSERDHGAKEAAA